MLKTLLYGLSRSCDESIQHTNRPTAEKTLELITPHRLSSFALEKRYGFLRMHGYDRTPPLSITVHLSIH